MQKIHILLIEDDEFLRELYTDILTTEGYEVVTATDGEAGLHAILKNSWDLILLDVMLPKMTGFDILKKLAQEQKKQTFPIILLTNLEIDAAMKEALTHVKGYLIKSECTPDQFISQIKKYLIR